MPVVLPYVRSSTPTLRHDRSPGVADCVFKQISEQARCDGPELRTAFVPKNESVELHKRASEPGIRRLRIAGTQADPRDLEGDILVSTIGALPADANHRVESPAPDPAHAVVTAKDA